MKKDKKYWFRAKKYGWGWRPNSWQGWTLVGLYIASLLFLFYTIDSNSRSVKDTLANFYPVIITLTAIFIGIVYLTGEKPHWSWGDKKKRKKRTKK